MSPQTPSLLRPSAECVMRTWMPGSATQRSKNIYYVSSSKLWNRPDLSSSFTQCMARRWRRGSTARLSGPGGFARLRQWTTLEVRTPKAIATLCGGAESRTPVELRVFACLIRNTFRSTRVAKLPDGFYAEFRLHVGRSFLTWPNGYEMTPR